MAGTRVSEHRSARPPTRSVRQNNWGNIKAVPKNKWVGKEEHRTGDDRRFERFETPRHGVRAIAMLLQKYQDERGADTVDKLLAIWAPKGAENPNHDDYVEFVADALGVDASDEIDVHAWETMRPLVQAICEFEQGRRLPADYPKVIDAGVTMAGIVPPAKSLANSRTMNGLAVAGTGSLGGGAGIVMTALGLIQGDTPWFIVAGVVILTVLGLGIAAWAYLDDRSRLRRLAVLLPLLLLAGAATAQDLEHPPRGAPDPFVGLMRPDAPTVSCCDGRDCGYATMCSVKGGLGYVERGSCHPLPADRYIHQPPDAVDQSRLTVCREPRWVLQIYVPTVHCWTGGLAT